MKRIFFRVNVNDVGYGHLKRSLSIAKGFAYKEHSIKFFIDDPELVELFSEDKIELISILDDEFMNLIHQDMCDILFLDGYFANTVYINALKKASNNIFIVLLDSLKSGLLGANLLINPGLYAEEFYAEFQRNSNYLLGPKYTILDEEYRDISYFKIEKVESILITMGGMDPQNITLKLLPNLLLNYPEIKFNVVIGRYFSFKKEMYKLHKDFNNLSLFENLRSLKPLIESNDICISSAGTTVFEIARCGVPCILFSQEENQFYSSNFWEKTEGVLNLGFFEDNLISQYIKELNYLIENNNLRARMSKNLKDFSSYGTDLLVNRVLTEYKKWESI